MEFDVVTVGEAMVLFAAQQPGALETVDTFARTTAGAELNVAIGLARLGLRVGYISRVGDDSFGRHIVGALAGEGIDHRHVAVDPLRPTGFMLKTSTGGTGDPQIEYFRKGSAASFLGVAEKLRAYGAGARHLHLTGISAAISDTARQLVLELATQARAAGRSVSFDPNLRPRLWRSREAMIDEINRIAFLSDWVLPGLEEGRILTGRDSAEGIADFYLERGARRVVVKLGPEGAFYADPEERGQAAGFPAARIVDTVGAGDGFAVGVISGLLEGLALPQAAARGNAIGARVVQFPGDSDGLPDRAQLSAFLESVR